METLVIAGVEQERQLSETLVRERTRLRNFIRRRLPNETDVEDVLQDVFYEFVEAYRMMKPIQQAGAWLLRVARNRIIDLYRKRKHEVQANNAPGNDEGELLRLEDLLPSPAAGPEAAYMRGVLLTELEEALEELPEEQREVFVGHEIEGRSFKEMAAKTGASINTLLARKRYAVLHLRRRLQSVYAEFKEL